MTKSKIYDAAIIGGGLSGAAVVCHLAKEATLKGTAVSCVLFEPNSKIGSGVAYSSESIVHLLNVPVAKMSIYDDEPSSFTEWLRRNNHNYTPESYAPRSLYGEYVANTVQSAQSTAHLYLSLDIKPELVESISSASHIYELRTDAGSSFLCRNLIIAVGNSPEAPGKGDSLEPLSSPWDEKAISNAKHAQNVAIVGTGLTAVDTVLALEHIGYQGNYTLISRRGLLPHTHDDNSSPTGSEKESFISDLLHSKTLVSIIRKFRAMTKSGADWRHLIDALRPHTQDLWSAFSTTERRRFIRHIRPYWDIHRHRVPESSLNTLLSLKQNGRLEVKRGAIRSATRRDDKTIELLLRNGANLSKKYDHVFNCTGLWSDLRKIRSPLIRSLIDNGLAAYDSLGLGFKTSANGELINPKGAKSSSLFTIGSLRRGDLWETTAAREIRSQAKRISTLIVQDQTATTALEAAAVI